MTYQLKIIFIVIAFLSNVLVAKACECPFTTLSREECNKYEIIFKGKIISVKTCDNKFGEAVFEIEELYKGSAAKNFTVLFECDVECAMKFLPGEKWIIYSRYKQVGSAMMDWCSRSRKMFKNANEDFYAVNYGNDYDDEVVFLRKNMGIHRILSGPAVNEAGERNIRPNTNQTIILVMCSMLAIILFYWLFNKFFR